MTYSPIRRLGLGVLMTTALPAFALAAEETIPLDPIVVKGDAIADGPMSTVLEPGEMSTMPAQDGGEMLRQVPGVTAGRMGGHGLELVIRGQQQNQLNVIDAGAFTYGGCPNRMDPPASLAAFYRADRVVVDKGYASVTSGPGGSGGTVRLERDTPELDTGQVLTGSVTTGASSNGDGFDAAGRFTLDMGHGFYLRGGAEYKTADSYKDGSGRTVRSGFDHTSYGVTLGYAGDRFDLAFDADYTLVEDTLYPGAGMDSPFDETQVYRLRGGVNVDAGALERIEGSLFFSAVDHVMDNYSLRPVGMMAMRTPATSDTTGGKIEAHLGFGATQMRVGIDHQSNNRLAVMYAGMPGMIPMLEAENAARARYMMWPDITIAQTGLYVEADTELSDRTTLRLGARYDRVKAKAGAANATPALDAGNTPNTYYTMQYGTNFNAPRTEDNFGALARLEYTVSPGTVLIAGLSRSVRTADATERGMARMNWVGNPDIKPEKHHQLDLGIQLERDTWHLDALVYADWVDDFILRDQFSVAGVTTYRNVSARLAGIEISGGWQRGGWEFTGDATYTYGENETDNRSLAQIPPLQGAFAVSYGQNRWRAGGRLNWAFEQSRIDPARDPGTTSGYATLDLFGSYDITDRATLHAGIDNVTDKTYANHLSRANLFDPTVTQVNEPGRTFYVSIEASF